MTVVPILRAGLGMLDGVLDLIPTAKISVVGLQRDEETLKPVSYFEKFVDSMAERPAPDYRPDVGDRRLMVATIDLLKAKVAAISKHWYWLPPGRRESRQ